MADKRYKALFVKEETHYQTTVEAKKQKMTVDQFVAHLLEVLKKVTK